MHAEIGYDGDQPGIQKPALFQRRNYVGSEEMCRDHDLGRKPCDELLEFPGMEPVETAVYPLRKKSAGRERSLSEYQSPKPMRVFYQKVVT
jgi:hypothetical protein